jgi:hypothetical protein
MGETTTVNITPTANVETQEYRDSMVQKIDQANAAPQPTLQPTTTTEEVKQEKILGKFLLILLVQKQKIKILYKHKLKQNNHQLLVLYFKLLSKNLMKQVK